MGRARGLHLPSGAGLWHLVWQILLRIYAILLILLVSWLSYRAFRYLIVTLMFPSPTPPQVAELPIRLDITSLKRARGEFAAVQAAERVRSPLSHYHLLESWIQPDPRNECTRSGCHAPLPHSGRKELRAFLNMHATSIHCAVCHVQAEAQPLRLTWYDLSTGAASGPPPLVAAYAFLVSDRVQQQPESLTAQDQHWLVGMLDRAVTAANGSVPLRQLAIDLAAVRVESDAFRDLLETARRELPRHFRGEYGAKLALLASGSNQPLLGPPDQNAVNAYLSEASSATGQRRLQLLAAVHPQRRPEPLSCTACHRAQNSLVDFAALGYSPPRIAALQQEFLRRAIERIAQGQPLYLPGFIGPSESPAPTTTTAPASP